MSEKLIGGVFNDPEPAPTAPTAQHKEVSHKHRWTYREKQATEVAQAVLDAMLHALDDHWLAARVRESHSPIEQLVSMVVDALVTRDKPTAHDALIAEARDLAEILPLENMSAWGHKVTLIADALTAERAARVAAEERAESAGYLAERAAKWVLSDANGERVTQGAFNALVSQNIQRGVERDALRTQLAEAREELAWYEENARLARLIHSEGDAGRQALANDGGERARRVLPAKEATNAH